MLHPLCVVLVASIALLAGCVGWRSSAEESGLPETQVGGYCTTRLTDVRDIETPDGIVINVRPAKDKLNLTVLLQVSILVPQGMKVRLDPPELVLRSPAWIEDKHLAIHHFSAGGQTTHPAEATLEGLTSVPPSIYTAWYFPTRDTELPQTGIPQVKEFTVALPAIDINGRDFQPEPITFRSYTKLGPSQCWN
jgi:hypothetical protein